MKLLKTDPKDSNLRLKIGDLYLKKGETDKAIDSYRQVAEDFSRGGFDAKAVAIYKQILRVNGDQLDARMALGDHFQRMGLKSDALREFQAALELCQKRDMKREAFDLLKRVASLNPADVSNRLHLADLLAREGLQDEARAEYESLLSEVSQQSGADELIRVAEQALETFPDHRDALLALTSAHVSMGQAKRALELMESNAERFPNDIELLEARVNASEALGDDDATRRAYAEMAGAYRERGDSDRARDIMQRHCAVESFSTGDTSNSAPSILLTDEAEDTGWDVEDDSSSDLSLDVDAVVDFGLSSSTGSGDDMLAEARVALEFGDPDEARRILDQVLASEPGNAEAQALLARMAPSEAPAAAPAQVGGELEEPVPEVELDELDLDEVELDIPADVPVDSLPDIELVLEDEEDRDPNFASIEPPTAVLLGVDAEPESAADAEEPGGDVEFELDLDELPEPSDGSSQTPVDATESGGSGSDENWGAESTRIHDHLDEAEFFLQQGLLDEAEQIVNKVLETAPNHPQALLRLGEIQSQRGDGSATGRPSGATGSKQPPKLLTEEMLAIPEVELTGEVTYSPPDEEGETADTPVGFEESGSADEENETFGDSATDAVAQPSAEEVGEPIEEIEPVEELEPVECHGEDEAVFDLAAELERELSEVDELVEPESSRQGFDEVFQDFKKGIQEQLGDEEVDAHYDLAIAYKEMGLLEDALRELEIVQKGGARIVETLSLMATCKLELGRAREAVTDLKGALQVLGDEPESRVSLLYELGDALLAAGQPAQALDAFKKVSAANAAFRDVAERIAQLE